MAVIPFFFFFFDSELFYLKGFVVLFHLFGFSVSLAFAHSSYRFPDIFSYSVPMLWRSISNLWFEFCDCGCYGLPESSSWTPPRSCSSRNLAGFHSSFITAPSWEAALPVWVFPHPCSAWGHLSSGFVCLFVLH